MLFDKKLTRKRVALRMASRSLLAGSKSMLVPIGNSGMVETSA